MACKSIFYTGRKLSIETRIKMAKNSGKYWLGKKRSKETILKIKKNKLGTIPWNKGKILPQCSGEKHWNWKGGKHKHRQVMECHLGRKLKAREVVHHINSDPTDNRLENLMLFKNNTEHLKYHREVVGFKSKSKFSASKLPFNPFPR